MTSSLHDAIRRHSRCDAQHLLLMLFNPFLEGAVRKDDGLERFPSEWTAWVGRLQHCLDCVALATTGSRSLSKVMGHRNSSGRGSVPRPYDSRCA